MSANGEGRELVFFSVEDGVGGFRSSLHQVGISDESWLPPNLPWAEDLQDVREHKNERALELMLEHHYDWLVPGDGIVDGEDLRLLFLGAQLDVGRDSRSSGLTDLLFIDQGGRLCLVEVKKRGKGNESRREVVAQLLDYAAGLLEMEFEEIRSKSEEYWESNRRGRSRPFEDRLRTFVEKSTFMESGADESSVSAFWRNAKERHQGRELLLLLVGDKVEHQAKSLLGFLNKETSDGLQFAAVEVPQFMGGPLGETRVFAPSVVVGAESKPASANRVASTSDFHAFLAEAKRRGLPEETICSYRALLEEWTKEGAETVRQVSVGGKRHSCTLLYQPRGQSMKSFLVLSATNATAYLTENEWWRSLRSEHWGDAAVDRVLSAIGVLFEGFDPDSVKIADDNKQVKLDMQASPPESWDLLIEACQ